MSIYTDKVHFNMYECGEVVEHTGEIISNDGNACVIEYDYYPSGCSKPVKMRTSKSLNDVWTEEENEF